MYSYEERLRAVELYIKLRRRSRATIRQLGYPTKTSLRHWHQEFLERGDLQAGYVRSKQKYSAKQKNVAIDNRKPVNASLARRAGRQLHWHPSEQQYMNFAHKRAVHRQLHKD